MRALLTSAAGCPIPDWSRTLTRLFTKRAPMGARLLLSARHLVPGPSVAPTPFPRRNPECHYNQEPAFDLVPCPPGWHGQAAPGMILVL